MNKDHTFCPENPIGLEVPVDSVAGVRAALTGGASRLELCSNLDVGGTTPSVGFLDFVSRQKIPSMVLVRPRAGDFVFSEEEITLMERDIALAMSLSLAGVVIGAANENNTLDVTALRRLSQAAQGGQTCLNRVFDLVPDPFEGLEQAIDIGFSRILTSGQQVGAVEGKILIAKLVEQAAGRIEILPGGGVNAINVRQILGATGVKEVHASCRAVHPVQGHTPQKLGFFGSGENWVTDPGAVLALAEVLKDHARRVDQVSQD